MTGQIIPLHGDEHHEVQLLLPWCATGRLDAADRARVEAALRRCAFDAAPGGTRTVKAP
jgi:hypothetical protein